MGSSYRLRMLIIDEVVFVPNAAMLLGSENLLFAELPRNGLSLLEKLMVIGMTTQR